MNQPGIANVVDNLTPAALNATTRIGGELTQTYEGTTVAPTGATVTGEVTGAASGDTLTLDTSGLGGRPAEPTLALLTSLPGAPAVSGAPPASSITAPRATNLRTLS